MIIREVISLYKLNWKAHLWSLLIPVGLIILMIKSGAGALFLIVPGLHRFNGVKFTLKKEKESGIQNLYSLLPVGKKALLLSRIVYFYLNTIVYLALIIPFYSDRIDSSIGRQDLVYLVLLGTYFMIYWPIKYGKKENQGEKLTKKNVMLLIVHIGIIILGIITDSLMFKIALFIIFIFIVKELFDDLQNYYPINRKLSENERY